LEKKPGFPKFNSWQKKGIGIRGGKLLVGWWLIGPLILTPFKITFSFLGGGFLKYSGLMIPFFPNTLLNFYWCPLWGLS